MFNRNKLFLFLVGVMMIVPLVSHADEGWVIKSFNSNIAIQSTGSVDVEEIITVDFGDLQKHGIFRDIPYSYQEKDGSLFNTTVIVNGVFDDRSFPIRYETSENNGYIRIKIGDPYKTVFGRQIYKIRYSIIGVLKSFDNYDEIYLNVTGDNWPVTIESVSGKVSLPFGVNTVQSSCYVGFLGESNNCEKNSLTKQGDDFSHTKPLAVKQGLTIAVGYTKGIVPIISETATKKEPTIKINFSALGISFILVLIIGIIGMITLWWKRGRDIWLKRKSLNDPDSREERMPLFSSETIVVEYESPDKLRPGEIGVVLDERADTIDVSATIVDLAVRGYLTITEIPKSGFFGSLDYELKRTKADAENLMAYEKELLNSLFEDGNSVKLSDLKNSFYLKLINVKKLLYEEVTAKKLFAENPKQVRNKYILLSFLSLILGLGLLFFGFPSGQGIAVGIGMGIIALFLPALLTAIFAMPKRTAYGREILRKTMGYKLFVSGTEKYRQPFFENNNIFMDILPYAMVFKVTKKLAGAMEQMGIEPKQPTWYSGSQAFNFIVFSSTMDSFSRSLSSAIASAPSGSGSGGSGFSGGGFGGGGGGSW